MAKPLPGLLGVALLLGAAPPAGVDTVIRGGLVYDGSGGAPRW